MVNKKKCLNKKVYITFIMFSEVFRPRLVECGEQAIMFIADKAMFNIVFSRFSPLGVVITLSEYNSKEYTYVISK